MGLDQYLYKKVIGNYDKEIKYWRKFNALHGYICAKKGIEPCSGLDNCEELTLTADQIRAILVDLRAIEEILESASAERVYDPSQTEKEKEMWWGYSKDIADKVAEIMPPVEGFFFGSQYVDSFYYRYIKDSIPAFEEALAAADEGKEVYYLAWY